jgi:hypothetical protein
MGIPVASLKISRQDSSVRIATGYGLDGPGWIPGSVTFFSSQRPNRLWGPPSLSNGDSFAGVKWQEREADHSPPSSREVKKGGAIPPLPHGDNFTL